MPPFGDSLSNDIAKVVTGITRRDSSIDYRALYGATIAFSDGQKATVLPDLADLRPKESPYLSDCLIRRPDGYSSSPTSGTKCLLGWEGGDPSKRYVLMAAGDGSDQTEITIGALSIKLGGSSASNFVVLSPIVNALTTVFTAVGAFATVVGAAVPALAGAAVTLNTAIGVFSGLSATFQATRVKAL